MDELIIRYHVNQDGLQEMFAMEQRFREAMEPYGEFCGSGMGVVGKWNRDQQFRGPSIELAKAAAKRFMESERMECSFEIRPILESTDA